MERARRGLLIFAAVFPGAHLFLWAGLAVAALATEPRWPSSLDHLWPIGLILLLGALGAVAVALPARALSRPGGVIGAALVAFGALYAIAAGFGLPIIVGESGPGPLPFGGMEGWVVIVPVMLGGFLGSPVIIAAALAGTYAASLLLGGALTFRSRRRAVDAADDGR